MGGYGSGRIARTIKAENCRSLDVNRFHRSGCLTAGASGYWVWSLDGEEVARISYRTNENCLTLDYRVRQNGGEWEPIEQPVPLEYVSCHYGGQRPYFRCPGVVSGVQCGRRVGKLFSGGRYFLCRHCYSIAYASQSEERHDRLLRKANKLRVALGGEPGTANEISARPKGSWLKKYNRRRSEITRLEIAANRAFIDKYALSLGAADLAFLECE